MPEKRTIFILPVLVHFHAVADNAAETALNRPKKSDKLSVGHDFYSDKRQVYVSADALSALRTCLAVRPAAVPGEVVFWNQKRPHRALSSKGMQKKMERYAKAAGIKASCHSLRHTFASNLLEEGAEVLSIKELLGHASMESSERYAKLSNQRVKQIYQQTIRKVIAKTRV